ncbi:arsenic resistance protein ArsH [Aspergillus fumigatus]|nr:arsenic resistance protein ArsH [Aspergillus fumigatus]
MERRSSVGDPRATRQPGQFFAIQSLPESTTDPPQTAVFKNQIDWIPLSTGSIRPTQGRTLAIAQVCGGSQSFNAVNSLRILGRWMRMFVIPNQSSIPKAYTHFPDAGQPGDYHLMPSGNRDRLVDCMEEFVKYTILMRPHLDLFADRYSEREERRLKQAALAAKAGPDV